MAMSDTTRHISWIKSLLGEIHVSILKVPLYCDNQGVIFLATNPAQEQHSKHIGIRYHYIRECVKEGDKIDRFYIYQESISCQVQRHSQRPLYDFLFTIILRSIENYIR